jgi:hypothetical protein
MITLILISKVELDRGIISRLIDMGYYSIGVIWYEQSLLGNIFT